MAAITQYDHLEPHGRQWRVVLRVPRHLVSVLGKTVFKKGLGTDSRREAEARAWPYLREWKALIRQAERKAKAAPFDPVTASALEDRINRSILVDVVEKEGLPGDREFLDRLDTELYGPKAERIAREHSPVKAREYEGIVRGERTPLTVYVDQWLGDIEDSIAKRTAKHYRNTVHDLAAYAGKEGLPQTIEAFDRRSAGDLISKRFITPKVPYKTARKYVSALSSYWRWLSAKGKLPEGSSNPWRDQVMPKAPKPQRGSKAARQKERPFTDDELRTLLDPKACAGDLTLSDFMLISPFSGMRIEEIACLRVEDIDLKAETMAVTEAKSEAGVRTVPIHPQIEDIIKRRISGKAPDDWLFDELPEYPPESLSERSMVVSKRFVTYRRGLGVDERVEGKRRSLVNFHSFRRSFIRRAIDALHAGAKGYDQWTIADVVGHERGEMGLEMTMGVYPGPASPKALKACVEAVKLPLQVRT